MSARWSQVLLGCALVWGAGCQRPLPQVIERGANRVETGESAIPEGMVLIPGGLCERGDWSGEGYPDERPARRVEVDAFYMDRTETSWAAWDDVFQWATAHGYAFGEDYAFHPGRERSHPVCYVSWYDAVKWCNARSEMEGRVPVYRANEAGSEVLRQGEMDPTAAMVRWRSNGYRLPTELEWEWAARGGLVRQHYAWASAGEGFERYLDGSRANYWESGDPWESEADCSTSPVGFFDGRSPEAAEDMANGYGLYDVTGNVSEWCWDWYLDTWYADPASGEANTRGPAAGYGRVLRGGSWISSAKYSRVSARYMSAPSYRCHCYGFRCVVGLVIPAEVGIRRQGLP